MILTRENYYTLEAEKEYMSCSQYQNFLECEAKALAVSRGEWKDEDSEALTVGNYFHTHFESEEAHNIFCNDHFEEIYKYKVNKAGEIQITGKKAAYEQADEMIRVAEKDQLIKRFIDMDGENEKIMTGQLYGIPWKIRLDKYIPSKRIILDWKTTANIRELKYNQALKERETFIEAYGYMMRAAVYSEIEKQFSGEKNNPLFIIIVISKQKPPDKEALSLNHEMRYEWELEQIKKHIFRIREIKSGYLLPKRCGICNYCRATKEIKKIIPYYKLNPQFQDEKEKDEYEYNNLQDIQEA